MCDAAGTNDYLTAPPLTDVCETPMAAPSELSADVTREAQETWHDCGEHLAHGQSPLEIRIMDLRRVSIKHHLFPLGITRRVGQFYQQEQEIVKILIVLTGKGGKIWKSPQRSGKSRGRIPAWNLDGPCGIAYKREMMKLEGVRVINIMADGTICNDLSHYLDDHELPENVMRLIADFIREGARQGENQTRT